MTDSFYHLLQEPTITNDWPDYDNMKILRYMYINNQWFRVWLHVFPNGIIAIWMTSDSNSPDFQLPLFPIKYHVYDFHNDTN